MALPHVVCCETLAFLPNDKINKDQNQTIKKRLHRILWSNQGK